MIPGLALKKNAGELASDELRWAQSHCAARFAGSNGMSFRIHIQPEWNVIKKIKERINSDPQLQACGDDFREAALLTAIELVENGLKYSDSEDPERPVEFRFDTEDGVCAISVTNTSSDASNKSALFSAIERIRGGDPFALYVERLEQVKENPDGFSRMGLIRIAYEGEFSLEARAEGGGDRITIEARRPLPPG